MWEAKANETRLAKPAAQDRLLRHYRGIGAPAVAAALDGEMRRLPKEKTGISPDAPVDMPAFLLREDHAV